MSRRFWHAIYGLLEKMQGWIYANKIPYQRSEGRNAYWERGKYVADTGPSEPVSISEMMGRKPRE